MDFSRLKAADKLEYQHRVIQIELRKTIEDYRCRCSGHEEWRSRREKRHESMVKRLAQLEQAATSTKAAFDISVAAFGIGGMVIGVAGMFADGAAKWGLGFFGVGLSIAALVQSWHLKHHGWPPDRQGPGSIAIPEKGSAQ